MSELESGSASDLATHILMLWSGPKEKGQIAQRFGAREAPWTAREGRSGWEKEIAEHRCVQWWWRERKTSLTTTARPEGCTFEVL